MPEWGLIILLLTAGFIFLLIELFVIPGFGFMGLLGLGMMGWGIWMAWKLEQIWGIFSLLSSLILVVFFLLQFPKTRFWHRLELQTKETGFSTHENNLNDLVNQQGETLTHLRPAGTALIDGRRIDVVTEGIYLPPKTKIKVVMVKSNKVIVRQV